MPESCSEGAIAKFDRTRCLSRDLPYVPGLAAVRNRIWPEREHAHRNAFSIEGPSTRALCNLRHYERRRDVLLPAESLGLHGSVRAVESA